MKNLMKKHILKRLALFGMVLLTFAACSGGDDDDNSTPAPAPHNPVSAVTAVAGDSTVLLTWANPSDADFSETEITFTPEKSGVNQPIVVKGEAGASSSCTVAGLENNTTYTFTLTAIDKNENRSAAVSKTCMPVSTGDTTPPEPVTALTAESASEKVILTWTEPQNADFYGVRISSSPAHGSLASAVFIEKGMAQFIVYGLENGTSYTFSVVTLDRDLNESAAVTATAIPADGSDTTAPAEVENLTVSATESCAAISWAEPDTADFAGVSVSLSPATGSLSHPALLEKGETSLTATDLAGGTYTVTVKAHDTSFNFTDGVSTSFTIEAAPEPEDTTPAGAVTNLAAEKANCKIVLTWTEPEDEDFYGVCITGSPAQGSLESPLFMEKGTSRFVVHGLENGTEYTFSVISLDTSLNRNAAATVTATPEAGDDIVPPAEVENLAVAISGSTATLTWKEPTTQDFAGVMVSVTPAQGSLLHPALLEKGETSLTVTELTGEESFTFTVRARDNCFNFTEGASETVYIVNTYAAEHGTVKATPSMAAAGATITLTPQGENRYALDTLSVEADGEVATSEENGTYTFTMPAHDVKVTSTFVRLGADTKTAPFAVGDVVLKDGTAVAYKNIADMNSAQKEAAVAVIFYTGGEIGTRTLGVGVYNSQDDEEDDNAVEWCLTESQGIARHIPALQCMPSNKASAAKSAFMGVTSGKSGWNALFDAVDDADGNGGDYPAWEWVNGYAESRGLDESEAFASGWYMPSLAELAMLYRERTAVNKALEAIGGTALAGRYWSASQSASGKAFAWRLDFSTGGMEDYNKNQDSAVCCIRSFAEASGSYDVSVGVSANAYGKVCTASASHKTATAGETVTLTMTPAIGCKYKALKVNDIDTSSFVVGGKYAFTMPEKAVSAYASFQYFLGTKTPDEAKAVGDIVFNDGSATPYRNGLTLTSTQKAAAVAVIFYVGSDCSDGTGKTRTLGVGLHKSEPTIKFVSDVSVQLCKYYTRFNDLCVSYDSNIYSHVNSYGYRVYIADSIRLTGKSNGSNIWDIMKSRLSDTGVSGKYPAWEWGNTYASRYGVSGTYASGWYLPTVLELCKLWQKRDMVNDALSIAGQKKFYYSSPIYVLASSFDDDFKKGIYLAYSVQFGHVDYDAPDGYVYNHVPLNSGNGWSAVAIREF